MEEIACIDSGCVEHSGAHEIHTSVRSELCDILGNLECTGFGRCGTLAGCAGNVSSDIDPAALGSLVHVDEVSALVYEDHVTGLTAVALSLLVIAVRIRDCAVCADLTSIDSGIGGNRSVCQHIVHGRADVEPALCAALLAGGRVEIIQLLADRDKAGGAGAVLGRIEVIIIVADLSVTGQDLTDADALCTLFDTAVICDIVDGEPAAAKVALLAEAKQLVFNLFSQKIQLSI